MNTPWPITLPYPQGDKLSCPFCDGNGHRCAECDGNGWLWAEDAEPQFAQTLYAEYFECASLQPPLSAGLGGSAPSQATIRQSTKTSLSKDTTPFESFDTANGLAARSCLPASGGSRAKSTPKLESCSPMRFAGPRSTADLPTLGARGHG